MKKIVLFLALLSVMILSVSCSDDNKQMFEKVKQRLDLNPEQATAVEPIFNEEITQLKEALKPPQMGIGERPSAGERGTNPFAAKMDGITSEAGSKLASILSADQLAQYNELVAEAAKKIMEENRPQRPGGMGSGRPPAGGMPGGF